MRLPALVPGLVDSWGNEIKLRADIERELCDALSIPLITVVVADGPAWVAVSSRVGGAPNQEEVSRLDAYVTRTLYGVKAGLPFGASLQCVEGGAAHGPKEGGARDVAARC